MSIIKKGYRVTVVSWENDGDNYATCIKDGLTDKQAAFITELCEHFGSGSNAKPEDEMFGNMYDPTHGEMNSFYKFIFRLGKKHGGYDYTDTDFHSNYDMWDCGNDLIYTLGGIKLDGLRLSNDVWFTRVCKKITVEYVEETIELVDVTGRFSVIGNMIKPNY